MEKVKKKTYKQDIGCRIHIFYNYCTIHMKIAKEISDGSTLHTSSYDPKKNHHTSS